jgi:hypothetical protein
LEHGLAHQHNRLIFVGHAFLSYFLDTLGGVHDVSHQRIVDPTWSANVPYYRGTSMDANPDSDKRQAAL